MSQPETITEKSAITDQLGQLVVALRAPTITIPNFNGNPLEYHSFIRAFEENVEKLVSDSASRLARLNQYCTGDAQRLLKGCMLMEPNAGYHRARSLMEERYGNKPYPSFGSRISQMGNNL